MRLVITLLLFFTISSCSTNANKAQITLFKCNDVNWEYFLKFVDHGDGQDNCHYSSRIRSGKLTLAFEEKESLDCWKSLALAQLDGSKCCIMSKEGKFFKKGMKYCKVD